jgi:hypothetical protein
MSNDIVPTAPATPIPPSGAADSTNQQPPDAGAANTLAISGTRPWLLALTGAVVAAFAAWAIGEALMVPDMGIVRRRGGVDPPTSQVGLSNATISLGVFGASLGLTMGLAAGVIRRSLVRAVIAGVIGLIAGGITGVLTARALVPMYYDHLKSDDLTYALIVHGGTWAAIAAVAGLASAVGLGLRGRTIQVIVGAAGAALIATIIYEVVGGIFFPMWETNHPLSANRECRLLAQLLVALVVAAGVVLSAQPPRPRPDADGAKVRPMENAI